MAYDGEPSLHYLPRQSLLANPYLKTDRLLKLRNRICLFEIQGKAEVNPKASNWGL